jgi:hypothetical protein
VLITWLPVSASFVSASGDLRRASGCARGRRCRRPTAPRRGGREDGVDDVVDEQAVATLFATAEELDRLALERLADEHRQEAELVAGEPLPGPVDVGEPQRRDRHAVRVGVHHVQVLAGELGHAVHVDRSRCGVLVDRQPIDAPVHLARAGVHHAGRRVLGAQHLEEPCVRDGVQLEVADRVGHRRRVAHLPGQVEHVAHVAQERRHPWVADVGLEHLDVETLDVAPVRAVLGDDSRRPHAPARRADER